MERGHRRLQSCNINDSGNRATSLALVPTGSRHVEAQVVGILVKVHEVGMNKVVGLGGRALDVGWRHRTRHSKVVIIAVVCHAVLERFQRDELRKLNTKDLGMTSQVMNHDPACLLLLCKITALVEPSRVGRIHVKHGWSDQLNNQAPRSRWTAIRSRVWISRLQGDFLDMRKRVFNLITGSVIVDIVCHAGFVG